MNKQGTLYIVGTPVGNLEDMSFRAVRILKEVDLIAAEDTRHTRKLLNHFQIHVPLESYHKFNEKTRVTGSITKLKNGQDIALVSNAGMPTISDPGEILVREAIANGITVVPVPGPCALILALAASGLSTEQFIFVGFLPRKRSLRLKRLVEAREYPHTIILYESGPRLANTITDIRKIMGDRSCVIANELTKKFEKIIRGTCDTILTRLNTAKGEFVLLVAGCSQLEQPAIPLKQEVERLQQEFGISAKEAIKMFAAWRQTPKRTVYEKWLKERKD